MQTFLPYADLQASCAVLDDRRLGKQRVETFQILRALTWPTYAWKSHPAVTMWRGFVPALVAYGLASCDEWTRRGYNDSVAASLLAWGRPASYDLPPWWGLEALHLSHRSALVRKEPAHYRPLFPEVPDDLPYYWPRPVFPRWPVRRGAEPVDLACGLRLLGYGDPLPGQAEAVAAAVAGRDVLLTIRPGAGASTAGLLAGLCTPGRTLWVAPPLGPPDAPPPPDLQPHPRRPTRAVPAPTTEAATARAPGPADVLAMRAEHQPSEWVFRRPGEAAAGDVGLVVVDRAETLDGWQRPVDVPVLAVVGAADSAARGELIARLGLRDPVVAGGGWDVPGTWLGAAVTETPKQRLEAALAAIRRHGAALVVVGSREAAGRLAGRLQVAGLRAASWAPTMRAEPAAAAVGAWRTRRLDALVVPAGELPSLGRRQVPLLLHADPPPSPDAWRTQVATVGPAAAVLLAPPDAPADVAALARSRDCLRRVLLEPYGELLTTACDHCSTEEPGALSR